MFRWKITNYYQYYLRYDQNLAIITTILEIPSYIKTCTWKSRSVRPCFYYIIVTTNVCSFNLTNKKESVNMACMFFLCWTSSIDIFQCFSIVILVRANNTRCFLPEALGRKLAPLPPIFIAYFIFLYNILSFEPRKLEV